MSFPLVSIGVVTYNHEKYIEDLIKSLLALDYPNLEVIIGDDCSQDRTMEIVNGYRNELEAKCKRLLIYSNKINLGITRNFNGVVEKCNGEYFKLIAGDDFITADSISVAVDKFEENPEAEIISLKTVIILEDEKFDKSIDYSKNETLNNELIGKSKDVIINRMYLGNQIHSHGFLMSMDVFKKIGQYDERMPFEDWDFNFRVLLSDIRIVQVDSIGYCYRTNPNSFAREMSEKQRLKMLEGDFQTMYKYRKYVSKDYYQKNIIKRIKMYYQEGVEYNFPELKRKALRKIFRVSRRKWFSFIVKDVMLANGKA